MVFLLNIGNTHTQMAECSNGKVGPVKTIKTELLTPSLLPEHMPIAAATVVPDAREILAGCGVFFLSHTDCRSVDFSLMDVSTLGGDRIANVALLAAEFDGMVMSVDFGTAINTEVRDEQKRMLGGAIAPGRAMLRRALHEGTKQLPLLGMDDTLPETAMGRNTRDAMRLGIDLGAVGMVRELIAAVRKEMGQELKIVGFGGDAAFFLPFFPEIIPGGENFTLRGIYRIWKESGHAD